MLHVEDPSSENHPAAHNLQEVIFGAPGFAEYFPAGQLIHESNVVEEY